MATFSRLLETLSYKATLARGYAVVRAANGSIVARKPNNQKDIEAIEFFDGKITLKSSPDEKPAKKSKQTEKDKDQGRLF